MEFVDACQLAFDIGIVGLADGEQA